MSAYEAFREVAVESAASASLEISGSSLLMGGNGRGWSRRMVPLVAEVLRNSRRLITAPDEVAQATEIRVENQRTQCAG